MLTGVAVALAIAAAGLAVLAPLPAAIATLSLSVGALAVSTALANRDSLRVLRSQRTAQQSGYERMRQILEALEVLQGTDAERLALAREQPAMDPRSEDVHHLLAGAAPRSRVLLIGGPLPEVMPIDKDSIDVAEPGTATLQLVPHGLHTHVLIEPSALARCSAEEIQWLRRAFRWQHDTLIAVPMRSGDAGLNALSAALSAPLATERRDRVTAVWAVLGGGRDWGRA